MSSHAVRIALLALAALSSTPALAGGGQPGVTALPQGCRADYVRPDFAALSRQLQAARARWAAQGPRSYTYDVHQIAAPVLFGDMRVTVRAGRAVAADPMPGQEAGPNPLALRSMEQRFGDIAQTLAYQRTTRCPDVQVAYDGKLGHPTRLYSGRGDNGIADGFGEWTLSRFTVLR